MLGVAILYFYAQKWGGGIRISMDTPQSQLKADITSPYAHTCIHPHLLSATRPDIICDSNVTSITYSSELWLAVVQSKTFA